MLNIPISNVPGPREHGRVGGALVTEIYSVGPLTTGSGLNITVWSYVDQLNISVLSDGATLADPHELTDAMVDAFVEIRCAAGLSEELTVVEKAMAPVRQLLVAGGVHPGQELLDRIAPCSDRGANRRSRTRVGRAGSRRTRPVSFGLLQRVDELARLAHRNQRVVGAMQDEERRRVGSHPGDRRGVQIDLPMLGRSVS